jgi:hypothetical protein
LHAWTVVVVAAWFACKHDVVSACKELQKQAEINGTIDRKATFKAGRKQH